jgi:YfiH family protein
MNAFEQEIWLDDLRLFRHTGWAKRFPTLEQGITGRARGLDFSTSAEPDGPSNGEPAPEPGESAGWQQLLSATGVPAIVRCRQVHGARVEVHHEASPPGVHVLGEADALVTGGSGVLLVATVADCVPVYLLDAEGLWLGLAHAGWRGTAAGVVEATLGALQDRGADLNSLYVHLGPAICGKCYEVGREVIEALGGDATGPRTVDLRRHIADVVVASGVDPQRLTVSGACTRCHSERFLSYRGGDRGRRMCAFLGWRAS